MCVCVWVGFMCIVNIHLYVDFNLLEHVNPFAINTD